MSNGNTARRCSCYHQTRTHAEGSGACRGLSAEQQSCYCTGLSKYGYVGCLCPPRVHEPCDCRRFDLAAVRLPSGIWMTATEYLSVCGAQFPGTTYRCGLTVHAAGRCHALDTTLEWQRPNSCQQIVANSDSTEDSPYCGVGRDRHDMDGAHDYLTHALLGRDEAVA